jgi:hypothetical protein
MLLVDNFKYYLKHQNEFVKLFDGRFIVLKNKKVIGDYATYHEAYHDTLKKHKLGTFIIQKCSPGEKDYTVTIYSRNFSI